MGKEEGPDAAKNKKNKERDVTTGKRRRISSEEAMFNAANSKALVPLPQKTLRSNPDKSGLKDPGHRNPEDSWAWEGEIDGKRNLPPRRARNNNFGDFGFGTSIDDFIPKPSKPDKELNADELNLIDL